jgi:putative transposase
LTHLAHQKPRYGYRRLGILLRREGEVVNHKRLFRVYRAAGLSVKRKKRKRLARVGLPAFLATRPNQQWSIDFVHDRLANGRTVRVLTVVDNYTPHSSLNYRTPYEFAQACIANQNVTAYSEVT